MIEINLVPDVKQELLKAERTRTSVISMAILVSIIAAAVVALLALYIFGAQTVRGALQDGAIKEESNKLSSVEDISNTLTIQNQLSKLSEMHSKKKVDSRLFEIITAVNPPSPNNITISTLTLASDESASLQTISLEGQAANGYSAAEVFRKTIEGTTVDFTEGNETKSVKLASNVSLSDTSYGEDSSGAKVLRFKLSFTYDPAVFSISSTNARFTVPNKTNVTDSFLRVPQSLFADPAKDIVKEEKK